MTEQLHPERAQSCRNAITMASVMVDPRIPSDRPLSEFRTGLDHIAFTVSSRDDLEAWQDVLAEKGTPFSPIAESPIGTLVVLRDPDNIQLEL